MTITLAKFKAGIRSLTVGTKTLLGSIVTGTSLMQIADARDFVIRHTIAHPRITSLGVGVLAVLTVLHNPQVQKFLHIEQETTGTADDGTQTTTTTDVTAKVE